MTGSFPDINENSIVLNVTSGNVSFILTGDAGKKAEAYILSTGTSIDAEILKAGHHGSSTSSKNAFLNAVSPSFIVMSLGADNDYGHPHIEALTLFAKYTDHIYRTDLDGDVRRCDDRRRSSLLRRSVFEHSREAVIVFGEKDGISLSDIDYMHGKRVLIGDQRSKRC